MSDTPRTDWLAERNYNRQQVPAEFARELERENARLQMELDASCNAEELRQYRHANQFLITNQGAYERERDDLVKAGNALRDALAFEGVKIGDLPREIKEWDALVSPLPNA